MTWRGNLSPYNEDSQQLMMSMRVHMVAHACVAFPA